MVVLSSNTKIFQMEELYFCSFFLLRLEFLLLIFTDSHLTWTFSTPIEPKKTFLDNIHIPTNATTFHFSEQIQSVRLHSLYVSRVFFHIISTLLSLCINPNFRINHDTFGTIHFLSHPIQSLSNTVHIWTQRISYGN